MEKEVSNIKIRALKEIKAAKNAQELESLRVKYLGRKGEMNSFLKEIAKLPISKRAKLGKLANETKSEIEKAIKNQLSAISYQLSAKEEWLDVTIPGQRPPQGHLHLVTQAIREITQIFEKIGFTRVSYPEVELDWYAFEGLNMPKDHPARDEFETFYIDKNIVLTPHTSSGQLREMENRKPPIRMINISKCYRPNWDITHVPMFYQFEGLVIDKGINITHLKGVFDYFAKQFYGPERITRLRPFHFQFTEPSFEVDINCPICLGKGCKVCKSGWHELGGAGMVHPQVLKNGGIDPRKYSGFAFGWGIERTYMMKSKLKIDDLRLLYSNDLRFLQQF